ncbi:MAG: magnesium chelatase [Candidatus Schekmanbacteria bacterium RIFCSPHIGHO2_02_FULL_38_11]|nr:MAG: magnesium chelatase [Candidatus Schekmanbacteria bacterium RIFCSPHIGHO2_02_FULL_38_11]
MGSNSSKERFKRILYPFVAIVGQEGMKLALLLNAINPQVGGVLVRGEKGTGKSTAVRALAEVLPEIEVIKGCPFNCNPKRTSEICPYCMEKVERGEWNGGKVPTEKRKMKVVDLPLGSTEDRLLGSLDIEKAIKSGKKELEPGILADVNRGILYVDEINLLDDHVVDMLLDTATSGVNVVEREGISFSHPSRFILVGTMNPEEGELRPQLLDRIALHIDVEGLKSVNERVKITILRNEFEKDPMAFSKKFEKQSEELRKKIITTQKLMEKVKTDESLLRIICNICNELEVEGHRSDAMIVKTVKTLAAFRGKKRITRDDVKEAVKLILPFRTRKTMFKSDEKTVDIFEDIVNRTYAEV